MKLTHFIKRYYKEATWLGMLIAGAILYLWGITHEDLWYDECYSASLVRHSIGDICRIIADDSHPPLYYLLLKLFVAAFGNSVFTVRLFSVIGALLLMSLGIGPIRRASDNTTARIFMFMAIITPAIFSYAQEVRMYTWAAFFVCGSAIYGYLSITGDKKSDWIKFGIFSLAAAYTHYYGLISVGVIHMMIFTFILCKERKRIRSYLLTAGFIGCIYLPWTLFLYSQVKRIGHNYWIPKVTWSVLLQTLVYPFNHKFTYEYKMLLPVLGLSFLIILFGVYIAFKNRKKEKSFITFVLLVYMLTITSSVIISKLMRPLLIPRYILVVVGMFLIAISFGIRQLQNKKLIAGALAVSLILSVPQIMEIRDSRYNGAVREALNYLNTEITSEDVFIHTDGNTFGVICYYLPQNKQFLYQKPGSMWYSNYDAFAPNGYYGADLSNFLQGHDYVYLVQRRSSTWSTLNPDRIFKSDILKEESDEKEFDLPEAWFNFSIQKMSVQMLDE